MRSPFLRTRGQLNIDGSPIDAIMNLLEWRIERLKAKETAEANVFRTMGSYTPANIRETLYSFIEEFDDELDAPAVPPGGA